MHDSTSAGEAVMAKLDFEKFARRFNVTIEGYHTDNHPFTSKEFRAAIDEAGQDLLGTLRKRINYAILSECLQPECFG